MVGRAIAAVIGLGIAAGTAAAEPPGPDVRANHVTADGSAELGILSRNHQTITAAYARHLWSDRLFVEVRVGAGTGGGMTLLEERVGVGLAFHPSRRVELLVGWRLGHTYVTGEIDDMAFDVNLAAVELAVVIGVEITPRWRLRMAPVVPTLFYHRVYAGSFGLEAGVDLAF